MWESILWLVISKTFLRYLMKPLSSEIVKQIEDVVTITLGDLSVEPIVGTSRNESLECKYVVFPLCVDSKSTIPISLKSINCVITYTGLTIQPIAWKDGDGFATNGMKMKGVIIKRLGKGEIKCPFNPFPHIPLLPESNERWGIKGIIEFQCYYGSFKKDFEFNDLSVKLEEWSKFRLKYQNLYPSVFGKKIKVVS